MVEALEITFPGLRGSAHRVTSPSSRVYNCIAWALGDTSRWWWPDPDPENDARYWPSGVALEESLAAFSAAFASLGYAPCAGEEAEPGFERIALFAIADTPTHAALQLPDGRWTSKLGLREDIVHELHALSGDVYGGVVMILKRPVT